MGRKGGLAINNKSGEDAACEKHIEIDEEKYKTKSELCFWSLYKYTW